MKASEYLQQHAPEFIAELKQLVKEYDLTLIGIEVNGEVLREIPENEKFEVDRCQ